jgi:hypothetical protein
MCQTKTSPKGTSSCSCGCYGCGCGSSFRRFFSSKEESECLENYKGQLEKELAGVEERIRELGNK